MEAINAILADIREKTHICVETVSAEEAQTAVSPKELVFGEPQPSKSMCKTYLVTQFNGKTVYAAIKGTDEAALNYALLISALIDGANIVEQPVSESDYLRSILLGECNRAQIQRYLNQYNVASSPIYVVSFLYKREKTVELKNFLKSYSDSSDAVVSMKDGKCVLIKSADSDDSKSDYLSALVQSVYEETGIRLRAYAGDTMRNYYEAAISYAQSQSAITLAETFSSKGDVVLYRDYILVKMLEELPSHKLNEYYQMLSNDATRAIFSDEEMMTTAEALLENSLNVSETARKMYLHRNTLTYRLEKIFRATGLNIREFPDAVTFRLITILNKLNK